ALGSGINTTVQINNWSTQDATLTNTGTIASGLFSTSSLNMVLGAYNGTITTNTGRIIVNNTGNITGNVSLGGPFNIAGAQFNNNAGGVWNVKGSNRFGGTVNAISNAGTINVSGDSSFFSAGSLAITNTGIFNLLANSSAIISGNVSGGGTFTIGDHS